MTATAVTAHPAISGRDLVLPGREARHHQRGLHALYFAADREDRRDGEAAE